MKIDVMSDTSYKSFLPLVPSEIIEKNVKSYKTFYVANEEVEAAMHFLYPLFEFGKIKKEKYKDEIKRNYKSTTFIFSLENLFGEKKTDILLKLIATGEWEQIEKNMKPYKRIALFRFFLQSTSYVRFFKGLASNLLRMVKPSGYVLAFCGLDGAGKTTILNNLNQIFVDVLKQKKVFFSYWRPYLLPELKVLFGKKKNTESDTPIVMVMDRKPRNKVFSIIKLFYYVFDYIFGSLKYFDKSKKGGVALFDRHYIDTVVFPYRFEMSLPESVFLFFYKFMPKPDITFFLWASPDEIHKRKVEFTKEEIQRQIDDYISVGSKIKGFVPIETNKTIIEEIEEILYHISQRNT
jgi:thymidylate kinase